MFVFPRYHRVLSALTQQSSELQDTRMLTEFLERVELEESQLSDQYSLGQVRNTLLEMKLKWWDSILSLSEMFLFKCGWF